MLILIFFQWSIFTECFLSFYKGLNHSMVKITSRHSPTGNYKIPPLQQNFLFPHWEGIPSYPLMKYSNLAEAKWAKYICNHEKKKSPPNNP